MGEAHWERLALALLGILQLLLAYLWREKTLELREIRAALVEQQTETATLKARVSGEQSALLTQLRTIHEDMQALRSDVQRALEELAEHRGARRGRD